MLPVPSSPFDETLFAVSDFAPANVVLGSLLLLSQMCLRRLSLLTARSCVSIGPKLHLSDTESAGTLPSGQEQCRALLLQNPSLDQMSLLPFAFVHSNGCISDLPRQAWIKV